MNFEVQWEELTPIIAKRIQALSGSPSHPFKMVNLYPYDHESESPCLLKPSDFLSTQRIRSADITDISGALELMKEKGKRLERNPEVGDIKELLASFHAKLSEKLIKAFSDICDSLLVKLTSKFLCGQSAISFFESFADGLLNDDSELLKAFENAIRSLEFSSFSSKWTRNQAGIALGSVFEQVDQLVQKTEKEFEELFKMMGQPSVGSFYGKPKEIKKVGETLNNKEKLPITTKFGVHVNPVNGQCLSLSSGGHLSSFDFEANQEVFSTQISTGANTLFDCCSWSPNGQMIGITINISKKVLIFDHEGEKIQEIADVPTKNPVSCLWLSDSLFCVGYSDGFLKSFNPSSPHVLNQMKLSNFWISGLEQQNESCLFSIDQENTVICANMAENRLIWKKEKLHSGCRCISKFAIKKSFDGRRLATGGHCDEKVKVTSLENQRVLWESSIGSKTWDLKWVPGDTYLVVLGTIPQKLVILDGSSGTLLMSSENLVDKPIRSMALHEERKVILLGDKFGSIQVLEISEENMNELK